MDRFTHLSTTLLLLVALLGPSGVTYGAVDPPTSSCACNTATAASCCCGDGCDAHDVPSTDHACTSHMCGCDVTTVPEPVATVVVSFSIDPSVGETTPIDLHVATPTRPTVYVGTTSRAGDPPGRAALSVWHS